MQGHPIYGRRRRRRRKFLAKHFVEEDEEQCLGWPCFRPRDQVEEELMRRKAAVVA